MSISRVRMPPPPKLQMLQNQRQSDYAHLTRRDVRSMSNYWALVSLLACCLSLFSALANSFVLECNVATRCSSKLSKAFAAKG